VEIIVTSVLQTTAGKMFFGRFANELERSASKKPARGGSDPQGPHGANGPQEPPDESGATAAPRVVIERGSEESSP